MLGLDNATRTIRNDDIIIVDGSTGIVIVNPYEQTLIRFEERKLRYEARKADINRESHLPARTLDKIPLQVLGNIELPEEVFAVITHGGDGIGLYRTEFQYLCRAGFPDENELFDKYKDVVEVMAPHPVTIRTLDIDGDKAVSCSLEPDDANPVLGLRGIRYCLKNPDVFETQLRAILRASAFGPVRILFPMISCYEEIVAAKKILKKAADALQKKKITFNPKIEIGIMIEVPSAAILADIMAREVDFFSIGTNDLIQFSLAVDRGNKQVAHLYQALHPAIIRMIQHVARAAADSGTKIFMCGEMAGDPINIPILIGMGIRNLSMNPQSIPQVKRMIRSVAASNAEPFFKEVLKLPSTQAIMNLVLETYGPVLMQTSYSEQNNG